MKKLYFLLLLLCFACAGPPGIVVYEKVGGKWQVKEVHLNMKNIDSDWIKQGAEDLDRYAK